MKFTLQEVLLQTRSDRRLRKSTGVFLSTAAFLVGLVLQPAIGELTDPVLGDSSQLMIAVSLVTSCSLLTLTNAVIIFRRDSRAHAGEVMALLDTIARRSGLRGEFVNYRNADDPDPYTHIARLFEQAEREILLLDHRPSKTPERYGSKVSLDSIKRRNYYDILTARVTHRNTDGHYLRYRRIIQLEGGPTPEWDGTDDPIFSDHCRRVLATQRLERQYPSAIKTSSVFFPKATITIIDAKVVVLELAIEGEHDNIRVEGDLVLVDEDGTFARSLCQLFEYIDSQAISLRGLMEH